MDARNEIRNNRKIFHKDVSQWIYGIFPQPLGLGHSRMSTYNGIESCAEAIIAFLDSTDYESAIRLAISLGGDSDTIACMTGGIAAAYYGIPDWMIEKAVKYLPADMIDIINRFDGRELKK